MVVVGNVLSVSQELGVNVLSVTMKLPVRFRIIGVLALVGLVVNVAVRVPADTHLPSKSNSRTVPVPTPVVALV
jgi:hypothetical protein